MDQASPSSAAPTTAPTTFERLEAAFPFPEMRPQQRTALARIAAAVDRGKRATVAELTTGSGKSPIGLAVAKTVPGEGGAIILTSQNSLSDQMMRDFSGHGLVQLRGRRNYHCERHATDCSTAASLEGGKSCAECPYREAKDLFNASPLGVTNYSYFLAESIYGKEIEPRDALVLDEAHNIEREILALSDTRIDRALAREAGIDGPPAFGVRDSGRAGRWLRKEFLPALKKRAADLGLAARALDQEPGGDRAREAAAARKRIALLEQAASGVARYLDSLGTEDEWLSWSDPDGSLMLRPLSVAPIARPLLFSGRYALLMSATVLDFDTFRRALGLPKDSTDAIALPSDFPAENRRIVHWPVGSMAREEIDRTLPAMAGRVLRLLGKYSSSKGLIHTHTYRINSYLAQAVRGTEHESRLLTHTSAPGSRERAVAEHLRRPDPTVLMSPSMTEGLDLKDDLSRFQIVCKVPYPFQDAYNRARMELDPKWYQLQTALALVQATGRSVRSAEDHAITIVLDQAFAQFVSRNEAILPHWWLSAVEFKGGR